MSKTEPNKTVQKNCAHCDYAQFGVSSLDTWDCALIKKHLSSRAFVTRPNWCPLREENRMYYKEVLFYLDATSKGLTGNALSQKEEAIRIAAEAVKIVNSIEELFKEHPDKTINIDDWKKIKSEV